MAMPLAYNVRNLIVRWRVTTLAVGAIALVVAVLVVLIAMANGFRLALQATGAVENAVLTQRGSTGELTSGVSFDNARAVAVDARVARDALGNPLASPEVFVVASLPRRDGAIVNVSLRGVTPMAFRVRQGVRIVRGRSFAPGLNELIVGRKAFDRYAGLEVGSVIRLQRRDWVVTGVFEANGGGFESEIWGDLDVLAPAFQRRGGYQSVTVRLADPGSVVAFNDDLSKNPRMQVQLVQERKYYDDQSAQVSGPLLALAVFVALVMGVGAVFGAMNTMYAIVAARARVLAVEHPGLLRDRVDAARPGGGRAWVPRRDPGQRSLVRRRGRELRGGLVRVPDHDARGDHGPDAGVRDGVGGWAAAGVARLAGADHGGAAVLAAATTPDRRRRARRGPGRVCARPRRRSAPGPVAGSRPAPAPPSP
jgi:putative ABC transport system permease protein